MLLLFTFLALLTNSVSALASDLGPLAKHEAKAAELEAEEQALDEAAIEHDKKLAKEQAIDTAFEQANSPVGKIQKQALRFALEVLIK